MRPVLVTGATSDKRLLVDICVGKKSGVNSDLRQSRKRWERIAHAASLPRWTGAIRADRGLDCLAVCHGFHIVRNNLVGKHCDTIFAGVTVASRSCSTFLLLSIHARMLTVLNLRFAEKSNRKNFVSEKNSALQSQHVLRASSVQAPVSRQEWVCRALLANHASQSPQTSSSDYPWHHGHSCIRSRIHPPALKIHFICQ